jgi:hypothetical protein
VLTGVLPLDLLEQEGMIGHGFSGAASDHHESKSVVLLREEPLAFQGQQQVVAV